MTPNQISYRGVVPKIKQLLSNFITQVYQNLSNFQYWDLIKVAYKKYVKHNGFV